MRVPSELPGWLTLAVRAVAAGVFFGGLAKSVLLSWPQGILAVAEDVADGKRRKKTRTLLGFRVQG